MGIEMATPLKRGRVVK
jgi:hypothetical protein